GSRLLVEVLDAIGAGTAVAVPQGGDGVSLAPKFTVADAQVRWSEPAYAVDRRIRAATPAPGAWSTFRGEPGKLGPALGPVLNLVLHETAPLAPGELKVGRGVVLAGTGTHPVVLGEVRAAGKKPMHAVDWARGVRPQPGEVLGS